MFCPLSCVLFSLSLSLLPSQVTDMLEEMFASRGWSLQSILIDTGDNELNSDEIFTWVCVYISVYLLRVT